ncbi:dihydrofolate reductase [Bacillus thuringiensis]|uniref:dihydrofolate reductase n=1 Tax=Bacillus thuringiensis TaxID=1428 RepID=UPI0021D694BE|nr:dihydrofolate reductase [Bacillus thuringiensis]MCU7666986.1 dihydrofolate reductase [Bacillus thuringiensis]
MSFSIIVATSKNGVIGVDNQLPWHLPQDLKYFKKQTTGKTVIMGRKTFESIGKPLPNRHNIILTRDQNYKPEGVTIFTDIHELMASLSNNEEHMVMGGGEIYKLFLPFVDKIYHTLIDVELDGDTTFFVPENFKPVEEEVHKDGKINDSEDVQYSFNNLIRM